MDISGQKQTRTPADRPIFVPPRRMIEDLLKIWRSRWTTSGWWDLICLNILIEPTVSEITGVLSYKLEEIWTRALVPTVTTERIVQLIRFHHNKYLKLVRYPECKW